MEGTRPVLVEIQALIVRLASGATPRRAVVGWDSGRLAMLLAVLEARCGLNFSTAEVYLNVAGRLPPRRSRRRPGGGGGACLGARRTSRWRSDAVWFGEVSLAGEIRPVAHAGLRLREVRQARVQPTPAARRIMAQRSEGCAIDRLSLLPNLVDRIIGAA